MRFIDFQGVLRTLRIRRHIPDRSEFVQFTLNEIYTYVYVHINVSRFRYGI